MLTRHFYEMEEVCYALLDCLRYRKSDEAIFWAREIVLSCEDETLTKTMIQAWIMYMGVKRIDWLDAWFALDDDLGGCQRLVLIAEFCERGPVDGFMIATTFWIASRGLSPTSSETRVNQALTENDALSLYWWLGSTYEKKPKALLANLVNYVDTCELFDSLNKAIACKISVHLKILLSVCGVQLLCLESYPEPLVVTKSAVVADILDTWSIGYKDSRIYSIESKMLPRGYKRVLQADALLCSPVSIMEKGCKFWQIAKLLIEDDATLESTVDTYFPDDIPDEWSTEERAKSHPMVLDVYKVQIKPESRMKLVWGLKRVPLFRQALYPIVKTLFKACCLPER